MSGYCVWRMYKALRTLLLSETRGDATSSVVHFFVSQRDFAVDVKTMGQYVSLLLIGWLIYSSLRNFSRAVGMLVFAARGGVSPTQLVLFSTEIMGLYFLSSVLLIRPKLPVKHQVVMTKALGGEHSNRFYEARAAELRRETRRHLRSEACGAVWKGLVSTLWVLLLPTQDFFDAIFVISSALSLAYFWAQHKCVVRC